MKIPVKKKLFSIVVGFLIGLNAQTSSSQATQVVDMNQLLKTRSPNYEPLVEDEENSGSENQASQNEFCTKQYQVVYEYLKVASYRYQEELDIIHQNMPDAVVSCLIKLKPMRKGAEFVGIGKNSNYLVTGDELWLLVFDRSKQYQLIVYIDDGLDGFIYDGSDGEIDGIGVVDQNGFTLLPEGKGKNVRRLIGGKIGFRLPDYSGSSLGYLNVVMSNEEIKELFNTTLKVLTLEKNSFIPFKK